MLNPRSNLSRALLIGMATFGGQQALALPPLEGTIVCQPTNSSPFEFVTLTLHYQLTPIKQYGDDLQASASGTYILDRGCLRENGTISGGLTPKIWYGGAFDVDLSNQPNDTDEPARFLEFREEGRADIWLRLNGSGDATELTCDGLI